jgi:signal transduction histidine kinase
MRAFVDRERAFTADVSHELRTPLSIVQGVVDLMEDDPGLDERQRERIARIRRAVAEMTDVTSALLMMAREDSLHEPAARDCDVCDVVRETIDAHRHLVQPGTVVDLVCHAHPLILAERTPLKIVVANLIRNAFAHTASGTVSIAVDDRALTVTDTGEGIRGEEIARVFDKHFKGAGSTGAGIGLSLVKRICERYGWETVIESAVGRGTTVRLTYVKSIGRSAAS